MEQDIGCQAILQNMLPSMKTAHGIGFIFMHYDTDKAKRWEEMTEQYY